MCIAHCVVIIVILTSGCPLFGVAFLTTDNMFLFVYEGASIIILH